ncbi:hypothetical protein [Halorussus pelagicus]|uniref:hypothetical protein n=1 Tax=Halorussus pelagicus TaxID=2505977 RepID=UPI000FFBD065|nr:hypothetical protein [Halorussus pelagicus]
MSDESNDVGRRNVLKKGAAAATVAAGGLAATSGSAAALDYRYLRIQGKGSYQIEIYADDVQVQEPGLEFTLDQYDDGGDTVFIVSGEVDGEINSTPDDYAQYRVYGFDRFDEKTWDSGVDVFYKADEVTQ